MRRCRQTPRSRRASTLDVRSARGIHATLLRLHKTTPRLARFIGAGGVLLVDAFFLGLIVTSIALVSKPALFRLLAARMPAQIAGKLRTTTDAVCAYAGKGRLVAQAAALGIAVWALVARLGRRPSAETVS